MADLWPWPADDSLTRARRVAREYRDCLERADPVLCARIDAVLVQFGQTWVNGTEISDEPVLTTAEAADYLAITPRGVRQAVQRRTLKSAGQDSDGYLFHRSDLNAYLTRRAGVVAQGEGSPVPSGASG